MGAIGLVIIWSNIPYLEGFGDNVHVGVIAVDLGQSRRDDLGHLIVEGDIERINLAGDAIGSQALEFGLYVDVFLIDDFGTDSARAKMIGYYIHLGSLRYIEALPELVGLEGHIV